MFTERRIALTELAAAAGVTVVRDAEIAFVGKIPTRLGARLVPASKPEHLRDAETAQGIAAFAVPEDLAARIPEGLGLIIDTRPLAAVCRVQETLSALPDFQWERFESRIDPSAEIAPSAVIAPQDVVIGPGTAVGAHAVIYPRTVIGAQCTIGAGAVIGMEAFDQASHTPRRALLSQSGGVMLGDHVTIQSNTTISRASFGGFSTIGSDTLIDALVYIAHDCTIGQRVTICSNTSISGRVTLGDGAYIGPQAAVSNGITVHEGATVSIGAAVTRDVPANSRVTGNFALPHQKWLTLLRKFR